MVQLLDGSWKSLNGVCVIYRYSFIDLTPVFNYVIMLMCMCAHRAQRTTHRTHPHHGNKGKIISINYFALLYKHL